MPMKTAEEWCEEMFGKGNWVVADTVTINQMRLEAMKEGMRRASKLIRDPDNIVEKFILPAAEQLTEKDLE